MIESLNDLFVYELKGIYYVETELVEVLGELAEETSNDRIADAFAQHETETEEHVGRVEGVFQAIEMEPETMPVKALDGLVEDKRTFDEQVENEHLRDLHYVGVGMKNERMEITAYQSLIMLARKLEFGDDVVDPLEDNLDSEKDTLRSLESISMGSEIKSLIDRVL